MVIEIITVGDELLSGMTVNSNAAAIGAALSGLGLRVRYSTTIGDEEEDILDALKRSAGRSDIIILTGGLGPTSDDRTRDSAARFLCTELVLDPAILADIEERFRKRGKIMADCNVRQAMIPGKVRCIRNQTGTAPGFMFRKRGRDFFILPGVPSEMICMMENTVLPEIKKCMPRILAQTRIIRTTGIPESELYQKLSDIISVRLN